MIIDIDSFVFTTEGHLLPLSLARLSPETVVPVSKWSISKGLTLSTCHEHSALLVHFYRRHYCLCAHQKFSHCIGAKEFASILTHRI